MQNLYVGSAGQAAVMSEFLIRGYNVAVPEVDRGDDLFVVEDASGVLSRVQVKTASGRPVRGGYTAKVVLGVKQLVTVVSPELSYVFAFRVGGRWADFIVISRGDLEAMHTRTPLARSNRAGQLVLTVHVDPATATCGGQSLAPYRNAFDARWPVIRH